MTLRSEEASLVYLVSDVITSLGGTFGYGQRLYRDLKVSFAVLVLEIQNADILLAFSEKPKLWRSFEQMSRTLDKAFCDDFLNAKYEQLQAEVEKQPPPASSWWNRFFTGWTDTEQECVNSSTIESYPSLGIARDLLHSPLQRDLGITELLTGDHRVIKELTSLMNSLAESLDSCQLIETDEDPNDEAYPNPLISEAAMCGESSIRHLSQTLYHTLHDNWPCQLEGHDHGGKLGHCVEAKFCLDPQWMARDPDPSRDSFFVILAGSGLIQECRIRWNTIE